MKQHIVFVSLLFIAQLGFSQELGRRARWDAAIKGPNNETPGAIIQSVEDGAPLAKAGIQAGDRIIQVNDRKILNSED